MSSLYPNHPSRKVIQGKIKLPHSAKKSSFQRLLNDALRLDLYLPTPSLQEQEPLLSPDSLQEKTLVTPEGDILDFDKVDDLLHKIATVLDAHEFQKRLTYYEYFSVIAQLVTGGYKAYRGKPKNAHDIQLFKKDMRQFLGAFIEGCVEDMKQSIK